MRRYIRSVGGVAAVATAVSLSLSAPASAATDTPFISELHYDNAGGDVGEAVEIEGPAGLNLAGWSVVLLLIVCALVYLQSTSALEWMVAR